MKRLRDAFVTGCLVLVPVLATIQLLLWVIQTLDENIRNFFPTQILPFDFKGLGILLAIVVIIATGFLTHNYIGELLIRAFDTAIRKVSIIGGIYGSIKKFLETIFNPRNDQFKGAVLVEFPRKGIYSIGFRTGRPDPKIAKKDPRPLTNIFVPCTPNPTSGFYLLVPEDELVPLDISVQEAFKIVISMGIVTSETNAKGMPGMP